VRSAWAATVQSNEEEIV